MKRGLHKMVELAPLCQLYKETFPSPHYKTNPCPHPHSWLPLHFYYKFLITPITTIFEKFHQGGKGGITEYFLGMSLFDIDFCWTHQLTLLKKNKKVSKT